MNGTVASGIYLSNHSSALGTEQLLTFPNRDSLHHLLQVGKELLGRLCFFKRRQTLKCGTAVSVRAIGMEDAEAIAEIFSDLSPESCYMRFCSPVQLKASHQLTTISQRTTRDAVQKGRGVLAFAQAPNGQQIPLGKARYVGIDERTAELAITIRDSYQSRGLGTILIQQIIRHLRADGYINLFAHVHPQNYPMQALLHKLGFQMASDACDELLMMKICLA